MYNKLVCINEGISYSMYCTVFLQFFSALLSLLFKSRSFFDTIKYPMSNSTTSDYEIVVKFKGMVNVMEQMKSFEQYFLYRILFLKQISTIKSIKFYV